MMASNTVPISKAVLACLRQTVGEHMHFLAPSLNGTPVHVQKRCMSKKKKKDDKPKMVTIKEAKRFMVDVLIKLNAEPKDACAMADHLVEADKRGFLTHGMARLNKYVVDIDKGVLNPKGQPKIVSETDAVAVVEGNNGLGPVMGKFAMELAIAKAKKVGAGFVTVKGSNHFGICGYYVLMAIKQNMFGMCGTNSSPLLLPPCSKQTALGTNPFGFGAAADQYNKFVLDCASTKVALGKIERQRLLGLKMPTDWAVDSNFKPTDNPVEALKVNALLPAGGYKGYGLAAMIDLLAGVLSGANYSTRVPGWGEKQGNECADLGHFCMAIDPCKFAPDYDLRLEDLLNTLRCTPSRNPDMPIMVAGDMEENHVRMSKKKGLPYSPNLIKICNEIAKKLCINPLRMIKKKCF